MRFFLLALCAEKDVATQNELVSKALHCGDSLSDLFIALLDFSKLDAGDVSVNVSVFDITELIDSLSEEFALQAGDFQVKFEASSSSCLVQSDAAGSGKVRLRTLCGRKCSTSDAGIGYARCSA